jgi:hypothetical protein
MRSLIILGLLLLNLTPAFADPDCNIDDLIRHLKNNLTDQFKDVHVNEKATAHAQRMRSADLDELGYMVKWELKRDNQAGPWAMKGNTFVHGVKQADGSKWMNEVGKKSFGLGYFEDPRDVDGTPSAVFRWKDKYFSYFDIQDEDPTIFSRRGSLGNQSFVEATFMASDEELETIKNFIIARINRDIRAQRAVRASGSLYNRGDRISPDFDFNGNNLFEESCANACTSMFNPRWLEHYDAPEAIKMAKITSDRGIRSEVNAKALVFYNFRNVNADAITIMGVENSASGAQFRNEMHWGQAGGMMWGFIPDRIPSRPSPNYTTTRIPINEWLR